MDSEDLASGLTRFEGQDLLAVTSGFGWLHLEFSTGWLRVVASTWEPWVMTLPEIVWVADVDDDPLEGKRLTGYRCDLYHEDSPRGGGIA